MNVLTETLTEIDKLLERALLLVKESVDSSPFPTSPNQPSNKIITPQKSFFSTKRKRAITNIRLAKPPQDQSAKLIKDPSSGIKAHSLHCDTN